MHRHILRLALAFCPLALLGSSDAEAGCGTATCPLDLNHGHDHRLRLQMAFEYIAQDQLRSGTDIVDFGRIRRPDHDELETINRNALLRADIALDRHWSLALAIPLVQRRHAHIAAPGHRHDGHDHDHSAADKRAAPGQDPGQDPGQLQKWEFARLGDLASWARYTSGATALALGISAPTGSTGIRNGDGDLAEPSLQPGRGAWGLLLEATHDRPITAAGGEGRLFASTAFSTYGRGTDDYRFGSEWQIYAGGQYPLGRRLDLLGQLVATWRGRDEGGHTGEFTDATGGTRLYLSPGLRYELGPELALYGYYQFPLYEHLNQIQLTADRHLLFGLDYQLDLF